MNDGYGAEFIIHPPFGRVGRDIGVTGEGNDE